MQNIYLIGEKDHHNSVKVNLKELFLKMKIQPDIIFSEGNGQIPIQRTFNPFKEYLDERKLFELPNYNYIANAINENYNKERNLEGNIICVEDYNLFNFQVCVFHAAYKYACRTFEEMKEIKKIENILNEFWTMQNITNKILDTYEYNTNEKEISNKENIILKNIIQELQEICVKKNYEEFSSINFTLNSLIKRNMNPILLDLRNEIFYENIKNNLNTNEKIIIFVGDAHMPFFKSKFTNFIYVQV